MGLSVNQDDRRTRTHSPALVSPAHAHAHDFAVCVSTDGKPCDIVVLCGSGRGGGSLCSETQSAWWVRILSSTSSYSSSQNCTSYPPRPALLLPVLSCLVKPECSFLSSQGSKCSSLPLNFPTLHSTLSLLFCYLSFLPSCILTELHVVLLMLDYISLDLFQLCPA